MKVTLFLLCLLPLAARAFYVVNTQPGIYAMSDGPDVDIYRRGPFGGYYDVRDQSTDDSTILISNGVGGGGGGGLVSTVGGFTGIRPGSMLSRFPLKRPPRSYATFW